MTPTTREKTMLLHYLMIDIRIDAYNAKKRMKKAIELAKELGHKAIVDRLTISLEFTEANLLNGRALRIHYTQGGFGGLGDLHGLPASLLKRSKEFQKEALKYLRHPGKVFADVFVIGVR